MGVIETLKESVALAQKLDNIDLYRQLIALQSQVFDLATENQSLRARVIDLERAAQFSKELTHSAPAYVANRDPVPYCATCWEASGKAIHLVKVHDNPRDPCWFCHVCRQSFDWRPSAAHVR